MSRGNPKAWERGTGAPACVFLTHVSAAHSKHLLRCASRTACHSQALDEVQRSLDMLSNSCNAISSVVSSTKSSSAALLADTERLSKDLEGVERKQALVAQFLETYQLTPDEASVGKGLLELGTRCQRLADPVCHGSS